MDGSQEIIRRSGTARELHFTIEGLWLDTMSMTTPYSRDEAIRTVYVCVAALFLRHFGEMGLLDQIAFHTLHGRA